MIIKKLIAGVSVVVAVGAFASAPTQATNETGAETVCTEQVTEAKYRKFTSPDKAGPFTKEYPNTNWKNGAWVGDVGEIVSGPLPHSDGWYVYKRIAQQTVNGQEIPCPTVPTTLPPETTVPVPETTVPEPTVPVTTVPVAAEPVPDPCYEDEPCWDCETMGNQICGDIIIDIADPAPVPPAVAETPVASSLPATGSETTYIALAALVALTAGLIFVKVARR